MSPSPLHAVHVSASLIRPLGAFERLYYRYTERNPMHFSVAAEFDATLSEDRLQAALGMVQRRHPLLTAHVEDRDHTGLAFYRAKHVAPVPITVHEEGADEWPRYAASELTRPFDRSLAPLVRAVLLTDVSGSTVILTFDHTVADGISAIRVVEDLVGALNGAELATLPVTPAQEEMIARAIPRPDEPPPPQGTASDPRMSRPFTIRTFDATVPYIHTVALAASDTNRLVSRCRAEHTTVHAAILTAASRVRGALRGEEFVRIGSPVDFRGLIGLDGECGDYFTGTTTGLEPWDGTSFWDQARGISERLLIARSAASVVAASLLTQQLIPADADATAAEGFFMAGSSCEMLISNLGVQEMTDTGPIRPRALWGPIMLIQLKGEYVTGVVTYEKRLRMVTCGYTPTAQFLTGLAAALVAAAG